jgi:hypothetical protein
MGAGRLVTLVMGFGSFWTYYYGWIIGRRSKHHTEAGPAMLGAWRPRLDGDLDPLTGVERVGLACAWGTSEECIFRGTQLGYIDSQIAIST